MPSSRSAPAVAVMGRFQPFHWGHFEYLVEAGRAAAELTVGITNPTAAAVRVTTADPARSTTDANPFTFEQRTAMITGSLARLAPHLTPRCVPCDLRSADLLRASLGECDTVAVTVYDDWGEERVALLRAAEVIRSA